MTASKTLLGTCVAALLLASGLGAAVIAAGQEAARPKTAAPPKAVEGFVRQHCLACHSGANLQGGLDLSRLSLNVADAAVFARWVQMHDRVQAGEMPPCGAVPAGRAAFLGALGKTLVQFEQRRVAQRGRTGVRRLNRLEYENSLREVLAAPWLQVADRLPEDSTAHLFNKTGTSLDVSHVQMTKYLEMGEQALRQALNAAAHPPTTRRYYAREERTAARYMKDANPTRATIPLLGWDAELKVANGEQPMTVGAANPEVREREAMGTFSGAHPATTKYDFTQVEIPVDGRYRLRLKSYGFLAAANGRGGPGFGFNPEGTTRPWYGDRTRIRKAERSEPVTLYALTDSGETRWLTTFDSLPEPAVVEREVFLRQDENIRPDASRLIRSRPGYTGNPLATPEGVPGWAMNWLEVEGPLTDQWPPASYQALFDTLPFEARNGQVRVTSPSPRADARRLLQRFAQRALRGRPVPKGALERYLGVFEKAQGLGDDFTDAMLAGFNAVLCSPEFLYLDMPAGKLDATALATRLSLFLWNGPPDSALLRQKKIREPKALKAETERLLHDPRSERFLSSFLDYWLDLRDLDLTAPDAELYPDYYLDSLLTESSLLETRRFFRTLVEENLPARNLVQSDFIFVNERLAEHYGLEPPRTVALQRVTIPPDSPRGGLLTQASVLKVTANGTTTSPVLRGVWIVERLLGKEIPPPPSGVEAIEPDTRGATTIREQLAKHKETPSCAACHNQFDPVGFALESFDVAGGWRERYRAVGETGEPVKGFGKNGHAFIFRMAREVESEGTLPDGQAFRNVREMKRLLLQDERAIARNLVQQLVVYATGAPVSFADRPAVEQVLDQAKGGGYRVRDLIHGVVASPLFRTR